MSSQPQEDSRRQSTSVGPAARVCMNVGYSAPVSRMAEEKSSKVTSNLKNGLPSTPQKTQSHQAAPCPLTPMANLKVLVAAAAASCAMERESTLLANGKALLEDVKHMFGEGVECEGGGGGEDDLTGRKTKSLAVLCKKFLSIAETEVGVGTEFSLETMASSLGTNRRRIYDIINVLESLEMIMKQSKNWYMWLGRDCLLVTLAKLKAMARDDVDFRHLYDFESSKENNPSVSQTVNDVPGEGVSCEDGGGGGSRWDKSLGVLCQKFVMLFLITPNHEVTLDCAGNILMPDSTDNTSTGTPMQPPTNPKTKVRRLYDIANVLTTLGLIRKKTFLAPNHRKMPGYTWCGPTQEEIDAIPVSRKNEFPIYSLYPGKNPSNIPSGSRLSRKSSFGKNRPFLHQYEVKGQSESATPTQPSSAPTSPVKTKESGFKRSLSFGGGVNPKHTKVNVRTPPVLTRPGGSGGTTETGGPVGKVKQWDYFNEIHEFESEMMRHAHKYPHVAPLFREFIQRYTSTLEMSVANGRAILPKPPTTSRPVSMESPLSNRAVAFSNPVPPLSMDPSHKLDRGFQSISPHVFPKTEFNVPVARPPFTGQQASPIVVDMSANNNIGFGSANVPSVTVQSRPTLVGDVLNKVSAVSAEIPTVQPSQEIQLLIVDPPSHVSRLECSETIPTDGYSKLPVRPPNFSTNEKPTSVSPSSRLTQPIDLTSALLNTLVSQKPIPATIETTKPSNPITQTSLPFCDANLTGLSPSAILAGQIVTCLQTNSEASQLMNQVPTSLLPQLTSIFSLPPLTVEQTPTSQSNLLDQSPISQTGSLTDHTLSSQSSLFGLTNQTGSLLNVPIQTSLGVSQRAPLGVINQTIIPPRVPLSLVQGSKTVQRRKEHCLKNVDKENDISLPKRPRLEL